MVYKDAGLASSYILRLTVNVASQNIALNTTTYSYSLVIHKGTGTGKWATGTSLWSVRSPYGSLIDSGSIGSYDFRNYSQLVLRSGGTFTVAGSAQREFGAYFDDNNTWGELGDGSISGLMLTPPSIPLPATDCTGTRVNDSQVTVGWTRGNDWTGAVVQRRTDGGAAQEVARPSGNISSYSDTTTSGNHKYEYRVAGLGGAGQSAFSDWSAPVFTTPAAPTGVTATKESQTLITVDATGVPPYATEFNVKDNGSVIASGVSLPYSHVNPNPAVTHTYTLVAVNGSLTSADSAPSNTIQLQAPPNAPINLTPSGGTVDAAKPRLLGWQHNPVDSSTQTKYQLRHRAVGASVWVEESAVSSADQFATIDPGVLFGAPDDYEWAVKTWGADPDPSPYSATSVITVIDAPGVAIVQPDVEWSASTLTVEWSYLQNQSHPQSQWQAHLLRDGVQVEARSGTGATSQTTFTTRLVEADDWSVEVTAAAGSVSSAPAVQAFEVVFVPPAHPVISGEWDEVLGVVSLTVAAGDEMDVDPTTSIEVERSNDGGQTWESIRVLTPDLTTITDRESISYGDIQYRATAYTVEGAPAETVITVGARSGAWWLSGDEGFSVIARLPFDPKPDVRVSRARYMKRPAGRAFPIPYAGSAVSHRVAVSGRTADHALSGEVTANLDRLKELALSEEPLFLLRSPDGWRFYGSIGEISLPRNGVADHETGWNGIWGYSFEFEETGRY